MRTAPMSDGPTKYMVWCGDNYGEYVKADLPPIIITGTVYFYLNGEVVKTYQEDEFLKYNPQWNKMEHPE